MSGFGDRAAEVARRVPCARARAGKRGRMGSWSRLRAAVRSIVSEVEEWEERRVLINRPWEEEFLHWVREGDGWHLHGQLPPPRHGCRCPTSGGWCLGRARRPKPGPVGWRRGC